MDNFILGASIFFFAASIALNAYSCKLLSRSIDVLHFALCVMDKHNPLNEHYRKEGTI